MPVSLIVCPAIRSKKRKEGNIYAILLPVPEHLQHYIQHNQVDNIFLLNIIFLMNS